MWTPLDEQMMRAALNEAKAAFNAGEVPVGAVITRDGHIIATGRNAREQENDPTAHAEIAAIRAAARAIGDWRLTGSTMYVTLEPCPMCAGAIIQARLYRLVFGAHDEQYGCAGSVYRITEDPAFPHFCRAEGGLMAEECAALMSDFMRSKRPNDPKTLREETR